LDKIVEAFFLNLQVFGLAKRDFKFYCSMEHKWSGGNRKLCICDCRPNCSVNKKL